MPRFHTNENSSVKLAAAAVTRVAASMMFLMFRKREGRHVQGINPLRRSRNCSRTQITTNQMMPVTVSAISCCPSSGTNDMSSPVLPPEMKLRSAGMMGSLRNWTLKWLATANVTITLPKIAVAAQKRLSSVTTTR